MPKEIYHSETKNLHQYRTFPRSTTCPRTRQMPKFTNMEEKVMHSESQHMCIQVCTYLTLKSI